MLGEYQQRTRLLVNDMGFAWANDFDFIFYINEARNQVAGEGTCIRVLGTLTLDPPTQMYPFSAITVPAGVAAVNHIRIINYQIPGVLGQVRVTPREWAFFDRYVLGTLVPAPGVPKTWAQYADGTLGSFGISLPDLPYVLTMDTVCTPAALFSDVDPEAIPPPYWTEAVPYYAAYLALLNKEGYEPAQTMMELYRGYIARARQFATPDLLPHQWSQAPDPQMMGRLSLAPAQRGN